MEKLKKTINIPLNLNKQIIDEINLARTSPAEYAAKLERFSTKLTKKNRLIIGDEEMYFHEGIAGFDEAIQFLLEIQPLGPLENISGLDESANELLTVMKIEEGLNNEDYRKSNLDLEKRLDHFGVFFGEFSELINYGIISPELIVLNFVLCDGDGSRPDRFIIFNELFNYAGISTGILPSGKSCTILNFVQYFYKPGEIIPKNVINRYTTPIAFNEDLRFISYKNLLEKKEQYRVHFEDISFVSQSEKKIKKTKEVKKKVIDKVTGKEVTMVKKTIYYEDGEEEVKNYVIDD